MSEEQQHMFNLPDIKRMGAKIQCETDTESWVKAFDLHLYDLYVCP